MAGPDERGGRLVTRVSFTRPHLLSGTVSLVPVLATGVLAVVLVVLATLGPVPALIAVGAAAYVLLLTVLGRERVLALTVMAAFVTAPAFRGLAPSPSSSFTPTDALLGVAVLLLLPTAIAGRLTLPAVYWGGVTLVIVPGFLASAASVEPAGSLVNMIQWLVVLVGLPVLYILWRPSPRMVRAVLWSYVVGHLASIAMAFVDGPLGNDRYMGLAHHPNAFAQAGLMVVAICLYLFREYRSVYARVAVLAVGAAAVVSVQMGGSRGAFLVVAVLVVLIPVVERAALAGFVMAVLGAVGVVLLPFLARLAGEGSALSRLLGADSTSGADSKREKANQVGWELFQESPLLGNGYTQDLIAVHNAYLIVAASAGLLALAGYLLALYPLARPLFGTHPQRRLCYLVWAYIGISAGLPTLWDRTGWVPMALAVLVAAWPREEEGAADTAAAPPAGARGSGPSRAVPR